MNEFKFSCPNCQQNIQATPEYAGMQINCPSCQTPMVVPQAPAAAAPPPGKLTKAPSPVQHAATSPVMATTIVRKAKKPRTGLYVGLGVGAVVVVLGIIFVPKALDKYQQHKETVLAEQAATNAPPPPPPDLSADEIVQKVDAAYKGMPSFSMQGDSVETIDMSQINPMATAPQVITVKFSVLLSRPNLYRIEWDRQMGPQNTKGAIWSSGKGDYVRTGTAARKVKNREASLNTAAASSGTLGVGFAHLFFDTTNGLATELKNYAKTNNETLDGRKCYVLTGQVGPQNIQVWIHKDDFLIAQAQLFLGGKMDDSTMPGLTAAQKKQMQMMSKIKGDIKETYDDIETNKVLNTGDFEIAFTPSANPKRKQPGGPAPPGSPARRHP